MADAERGRLQGAGTRHGHAALFGLQLEEEVHGGGAPVRPQRGEWVGRRGGHRIGHVAHLERHRLDAGARQLGATGTSGEAGDDAAGIGVPLRAAESGERGDERHAAAVGHRCGKGSGFGGVRDDAEPVAQPLDGGAGDECGAFERVGDGTVGRVGVRTEVPRDADDEAVGRGRTVGAGVGQREAAGAVGDLHHAGLEAGLTEERSLLVAEDGRDRDAVEDVLRPDRGHRARRCRSGRRTGAPRGACVPARRRGRRAPGTTRATACRGGACGLRWRGRWRRCPRRARR